MAALKVRAGALVAIALLALLLCGSVVRAQKNPQVLTDDQLKDRKS